jgi:hypothetical protein
MNGQARRRSPALRPPLTVFDILDKPPEPAHPLSPAKHCAISPADGSRSSDYASSGAGEPAMHEADGGPHLSGLRAGRRSGPPERRGDQEEQAPHAIIHFPKRPSSDHAYAARVSIVRRTPQRAAPGAMIGDGHYTAGG